MIVRFLVVTALSIPILGIVNSSGFGATSPDFLRDVRPVLSSHCFKCHGPDDAARKSGLRLDLREAALHPGKSGDVAIVPGHPEKSALVTRISTTNEDEQMPPPAVKHPLSDAQKDVLRRWIAAGAEYRPHWAFVAPHAASPPRVKLPGFVVRNPIDAFIGARLQQERLEPSPEGDRLTLIRRLSLDLIGLPPTPEEADAFAADTGPDAYERLVDRLLASPHYGERWARKWLDLARYADSNGYEKDRERSIWPYRDWVIRALNQDMPFDQFTIEQLAGDLLPGATLEQRVATGFHRNTMLNEEGGIDPLEFRFHAMVDRVNTTATAWLGLTMGCAQCHTHKYDPIQQQEYYQFMAFLNNADEPELDLPPANSAEQERTRSERATRLLAALPSRWPIEPGPLHWEQVRPTIASIRPTNDAPRVLADGSILFVAPGPDKADVTLTFDTALTNITHLQLEALTHESLPNGGPGRTPHGNFVLSEISITQRRLKGAESAAAATTNSPAVPVKIRSATATTEQNGFAVDQAFDGKTETGWAVHQTGRVLNTNHTATFAFETPAGLGTSTRFTVRLRQQHGSEHTLGRLALRMGVPEPDSRNEIVRREEALERAFVRWMERERKRTVTWRALQPTELRSNLPLLTLLPDNSVLASGDISKSDTYDLAFTNLVGAITGIRLEALPDESLPAHGPGLTYYEGPKGDFFLGEFQVKADGQTVHFARATESYAKNNFGSAAGAKATIDGDPQTGWSCADRPGESHQCVFVPEKPMTAQRLDVRMLFGRHYACSLGRFRISVTTDAGGGEASGLPDDLASLLGRTAELSKLSADERARLREHFLLTAPELAAPAREIRELRKPASHQTTLVLRERPAKATRPTFIHKRGEFLQPTTRVEAGVPQFLPPLSADARRDRLALARWLSSRDNPLTARVVVNRQWAAFFGQGIVGTQNDFGFQGDLPTHPELLDWLAVRFMDDGWSLKKLHRWIVTSSTYRQSSRMTPTLLARDPQNRLFARGPRVRLDAEVMRDTVLFASGVLSEKMFGPPVRPAQPSGVTEVAYGSPRWDVSAGEDRYRRSLYTFQKRSAPFAMFNTFDAPSGETCVARREVSNTPLQALTLLNDIALVEAARHLGILVAQQTGDDAGKTTFLFRRVLTRPPSTTERARLMSFLNSQRTRLQQGELDAADLAGPMEKIPGQSAAAHSNANSTSHSDANSKSNPNAGNTAVERAVWTSMARALLNLDEAITKQ